jgi:hypothetical protein
MESFPEALLAQVPRLGATQGQSDPMVWALLANPISGWRWYIIELEPLATDTVCRVYEVGWDSQLTYFNLSDLELHAAQIGAPNAVDTNFVPCRLSEVRAQEGGGSAKFPLGRVVATPGALAALEHVGHIPLNYVRRHATGDWGDLDQHDVLVNENALVHGGRLLSSYILTHTQRLWVITEHDRSATTLLLPSEY